MLSIIEKFFSEVKTSDQKMTLVEKRKIACVLLLEVGLADDGLSEEELSKICDLMIKNWSIDRNLIDEVINYSRFRIENSVSFYEFTKSVNDLMSYEEKFDLIKNMWEIAFVDKYLDKYEEFAIRKIANLIYISHQDFIKAKIEAKKIMMINIGEL